MSLDCSPANTNEDQESAAAEDDGSISYALHALSELHLAAEASAEHPAGEAATIETSAAPRAFLATETLAAEASATEPAAESAANSGDALQSALGWYKDWLTSI